MNAGLNNGKMAAVVFREYGPPEVLHIEEIEKPRPNTNEVLIKVIGTSVTKYDCWVRSATAPPGFGLLMRLASGRKPKQQILGTELSGVVEAVGEEIARFKAGDQVLGYTGMDHGTYAEYICLPEQSVVNKPTNLSHEEAAGVLQGALTARYFLEKAALEPGQKMLIFGASGGVGGYAVQLAKHHYGAKVTGVCSTPKLEYVKSLGADHVIDYTREDFTENNLVYDIVFDTVGKTPVMRTKRSLRENGCYLLATFGLPMLLQLLWLSKTTKLNLEYGTLDEKNEDLIAVKNLIEGGVISPVIDKCFPKEEAAEAHQYVESGKKIGNVILIMDQLSYS